MLLVPKIVAIFWRSYCRLLYRTHSPTGLHGGECLGRERSLCGRFSLGRLNA